MDRAAPKIYKETVIMIYLDASYSNVPLKGVKAVPLSPQIKILLITMTDDRPTVDLRVDHVI